MLEWLSLHYPGLLLFGFAFGSYVMSDCVTKIVGKYDLE